VIIVDTNVLVALTDRDDQHHSRCRQWLATTESPLLVPSTVLAEACYLIDRELGPETEAAFLDDVGTTSEYPYRLVELVDADLRRMAELVRRYADRRLGGTDASIVAIAERVGTTTVATLNRRDFDNLRPKHAAALDIVPAPR
jgi:predicted nucleic acid-binding protein